METTLALDLKVLRRQSGLSQDDVAHFLAVDRTLVSKFERGSRQPGTIHLTCLAVIYEKPVSDLYAAALPLIYQTLSTRLETFPNRDDYAKGVGKKADTLNALAARLKASSHTAYEG